MEYRIVTSASSDHLAAQICRFLSDGWQLQGGVAIAWNGLNPMVHAQALVRFKEKQSDGV